ncbi:hypothetical protein ACHAW5_000923 [Stephanodiscus triporus]|uniref:Autophagy-related protein 9 n=1 Tax=Stephanodiscus triporus TaxID=2934178 RepID=A0ABD3N2G0_9STRA
MHLAPCGHGAGWQKWDELPSPLQTAAVKLGYNEKVWDNHERPARSDVSWSVLTAEQKHAAVLLGYTQQNWDGLVELARGVKSLQNKIIKQQKQLKKLLKENKGAAHGQIFRGREDSAMSHLEIDPDVPRQRQYFTLWQDSLLWVLQCFLHEYYYSFPACMVLVAHCFLYNVLGNAIGRITEKVCTKVISYVSGWHFVDNHFDPTSHHAAFFLVAILISMTLARLTGAIFVWNDNEEYQRRLDKQLRNRWRMGCWDVRIMSWFSGDEMGKKYDRKHKGPTNHLKGNIWGPRIKLILDVLSFFVCYSGVNFFADVWVYANILDMKDSIMEGLPSRNLHQQCTKQMGNEKGGDLCIGVVGGDDDTTAVRINSTDLNGMPFVSDVFNWATNADRCGWVNFGEASGHDKETDGDEGNGKYDFCTLSVGNTTCVRSDVTEMSPKKAYPWKRANAEWIQRMNLLDDEYLRASISSESYYSFVGDPHGFFINDERYMIFQATVITLGFAGLYWFEIPFLLL